MCLLLDLRRTTQHRSIPLRKRQSLVLKKHLPRLWPRHSNDGVLSRVEGEVAGARVRRGFLEEVPSLREELQRADDGEGLWSQGGSVSGEGGAAEEVDVGAAEDGEEAEDGCEGGGVHGEPCCGCHLSESVR